MAARPEGYSLSRSGKVVTELSTRVKWENIGDADAPLWVQLDDADAAASVEMREESIKSKDKQWMQWQRQEAQARRAREGAMPPPEHHPRQSQLDRNLGALLMRSFSRGKEHKAAALSPPPPVSDPTLELVKGQIDDPSTLQFAKMLQEKKRAFQQREHTYSLRGMAPQ